MTVDFIQTEGFVGEISTNILSLQGLLTAYADLFDLALENGFQKQRNWSDVEAENYIEHLMVNEIEHTTLIFDTHVFNDYSKVAGEATTIVCLDGVQRIRAFEKYVNGEIHIAGKSFSHYEDFNSQFKINILFVPFNSEKEKAETFLKLNAKEMTFKEVDRIANQYNIDVTAFNNVVSEEEAISAIDYVFEVGVYRKNDSDEEILRFFKAAEGSAERLSDALYLAYRNNVLSEETDGKIKSLVSDMRLATGGRTYTFLTEEERQMLNVLKETINTMKINKVEGELVCH